MRKIQIKKVFCVFMLCLLVFSIPAIYSNAETKPKSPRPVRIWRYSDTSVRLKWGKVKKADGYIIYKYNKSTKKYKKYKMIPSKNTCVFIDEIGRGKIARYKIRAYKKRGKKKILSTPSYEVCARAYKRNDKKVNAGKTELKFIDEDKTEADWVDLAYYDSVKISSQITPSKYAKSKKKRVISKKLNWYSTNKGIATVNEEGVVTAKGKAGVCSIYTRAHNGKKSNEFYVRVKNYAKPNKDSLELDDAYESPRTYGMTLEMFGNYYNTVTDIAEYFYQNRPAKGNAFGCWMEDGVLKMQNENQLPDEIKQKIMKFVKDFPYELAENWFYGTYSSM